MWLRSLFSSRCRGFNYGWNWEVSLLILSISFKATCGYKCPTSIPTVGGFCSFRQVAHFSNFRFQNNYKRIKMKRQICATNASLLKEKSSWWKTNIIKHTNNQQLVDFLDKRTHDFLKSEGKNQLGRWQNDCWLKDMPACFATRNADDTRYIIKLFK